MMTAVRISGTAKMMKQRKSSVGKKGRLSILLLAAAFLLFPFGAFADSAKTAASSPVLTPEEQTYIDTAEPIMVKTYVEHKPMGYLNGAGELAGILPDYLDKLGELCGLEFTYAPAEYPSLEKSAEDMTEEDYCLLFMDQDLDKLKLNETLSESDALFETALGYVKKKEGTVSKWGAHTFALSSDMHHLEPLLLDTNNKSVVNYYNTSNECVDAVLNGKAEMAILDEHMTAYLLQKPKYAAKLVQVPGSGAFSNGMCLYAPKEHELLISILNKTLQTLDEKQRRYIISNSTLSHAYQYQLDDVLYEYGILIMAFVIIFILLVLLMIRVSHFKIQQRENEIMQAKLMIDELTGIYHRTAFFEKATERISANANDLCIIRINISRFKLINELYGSDKGDLLLKEIGAHLKDLSASYNLVAGHFSADRFYLCITMKDFQSIGFEKRKAVSKLGTDIALIYGVYPLHNSDDLSISAMCDRADMAITFSDHASSEHIFYYNEASHQKMLHQQKMENEMESALLDKHFYINIQPKFNVETEAISGGEALVRWKHPQEGIIPPGDFIDLFEKNGFILKLDRYVWEESCRLLAETKEKGLPVLPVSVNVSRVHFYSTELQDTLISLVRKYGLQPDDLELEITESICSQEPEVIFSKCSQLRQLGFKIAMDDFGSGYSSLNMLKRMPLDIIKMDLRFLSNDSDESQKEKGQNILRSLIELAHTLNIKVVVEGIETKEQVAFIRSIGRCTAQGYYYSKPTDRQRYMEMLK